MIFGAHAHSLFLSINGGVELLRSQGRLVFSFSESESHSVTSDALRPHRLYSPYNSPGQNTMSGLPFPSPGDLPNPGIKPRSPALQADSLPAEPQGKPKNTGVGSLSLLQRIFQTQKSNWGLLYCRQILYQLNYQGTPSINFSRYCQMVFQDDFTNLHSTRSSSCSTFSPTLGFVGLF